MRGGWGVALWIEVERVIWRSYKDSGAVFSETVQGRGGMVGGEKPLLLCSGDEGVWGQVLEE